jgi:hypothetical protein
MPTSAPARPPIARADGRAAEHRHERTRRDEGACAGDREAADADEQAERPAEHSARRAAGRRALGRLRGVLVREVARRRLVGHEHGDVVAREAGGLEIADEPRRPTDVGHNAENGLACHGSFL